MAVIKLRAHLPQAARDGAPDPPRAARAYSVTSTLMVRGLAASFFGSVIESTPLR